MGLTHSRSCDCTGRSYIAYPGTVTLDYGREWASIKLSVILAVVGYVFLVLDTDGGYGSL